MMNVNFRRLMNLESLPLDATLRKKKQVLFGFIAQLGVNADAFHGSVQLTFRKKSVAYASLKLVIESRHTKATLLHNSSDSTRGRKNSGILIG